MQSGLVERNSNSEASQANHKTAYESHSFITMWSEAVNERQEGSGVSEKDMVGCEDQFR